MRRREETFGVLAVLFAALPAVAATHTVVPGDHLWGLAGQYYSNHFRWKAIYAANQEKIKDPHWIYPGQVFVIPELPGPEVGEIGARPVEAAAAVPAPAPEAAEPPEPAEPAEPPPPPAPEKKGPAPEAVKSFDDLSAEMPKSFSGQYPSMTRMKAPKAWEADGRITEFEGREIMVAQGDLVAGKLTAKWPASIGQKFTVYRKDAPQELDEDQKALYLQTVGQVEVKEDLGKSRYRFRVLKSGDSLQVGDLLKQE